jgi:hypothetical protein
MFNTKYDTRNLRIRIENFRDVTERMKEWFGMAGERIGRTIPQAGGYHQYSVSPNVSVRREKARSLSG